ncbi:MAG: hypothetical protein ABI615_01915 [Chthoniobacterales bacterium]
MKFPFIYQTLALAGVVLLSASGLRAQTPREDRWLRGMTQTPEQIVKKMKADLDLTEAQVKQIQPIMEERQAAMKPIIEDETLTRQQKREKVTAIHKVSILKLDDILTPAQKTKAEELKQQQKDEREKMWKARQAGEAGAPPASPAPAK